jgi:hypothetical protein
MMTSEYLKLGAGCFHLPSVFQMGKEQFMLFYMARCNYVTDERERKIYLTEVWKQAEAMMRRADRKQAAVIEKMKLEENTKDEQQQKPTGKKRTRKNGVSKE